MLFLIRDRATCGPQPLPIEVVRDLVGICRAGYAIENAAWEQGCGGSPSEGRRGLAPSAGARRSPCADNLAHSSWVCAKVRSARHYRPNMNDLAKTPPKHETEEIDRLTRFIGEFDSESDRAVVILGAARVDQLLGELLRGLLLPCASSKDELFEMDGPLGTFSSRIAMGHRIGLLNADFTQSLTLLRKCRNSFAHQVSGCSMQNGSEADRIREFVKRFRKEKGYEDMREMSAKSHSGLSAEFRAALAWLVARLEFYVGEVERVNVAPIPFP